MPEVLVISCNPETSSFDHALANAYCESARSAGASVNLLDLGTLKFDPILHHGYKEVQPLEPDLLYAQKLIKAADHIVLVYPSWWGSIPALFKGFIDRVFLPGFAFRHHEKDMLWDKLLTGKTARIILTQDSPGWWNWLVYRRSNIHSVKSATLQYCGIKPVRVTSINKVGYLTPGQREQWLKKVTLLGGLVK